MVATACDPVQSMVGNPRPASGSGVNAVATLCDVSTRTFLLVTASCVGLWWACGDGSAPTSKPRTFLMGFSAIRACRLNRRRHRRDQQLGAHADAAIMHVSRPGRRCRWVRRRIRRCERSELPLANYYRAKGLEIVFNGGATDGLNARRSAGARECGSQHHDTTVQRLYREWVFAVANRSGLSTSARGETNLIRQLAPDSVYQALVTVATRPLRRSAPQVCRARCTQCAGRDGVGPAQRAYQGIAQDLADFPFVEAFGYRAILTSADLRPRGDSTRLLQPDRQSATLPVLVVEGGWPSVSVAMWCFADGRGAIHHAPGTAAGQRRARGCFSSRSMISICVGSRRSHRVRSCRSSRISGWPTARCMQAGARGVGRRLPPASLVVRVNATTPTVVAMPPTIMLTIRTSIPDHLRVLGCDHRAKVELLQRAPRAIAVWSRFPLHTAELPRLMLSR